MKRQVIYLVFIILLSVLPNTAKASEKYPVPVEKHNTELPKEVKTILNRLNEIKNMDKSQLSREERKELRKEVRDIKKTIKQSGRRGIFISTGAIIIILLVLLIL